MAIKEYQNLTSLNLHRIRQILGECIHKIDLKHKVINEVLNDIFNVVPYHDSILLLSKTLDKSFTNHVLIMHKMQLLNFVFVYIESK